MPALTPVRAGPGGGRTRGRLGATMRNTKKGSRKKPAGSGIILLAVWLTGLISWAGCAPGGTGDRAPAAVPEPGSGGPVARTSPLDATFTIEGKRLSMTGGRHEEPAAPGSAAMAVIQVLGKPAYGDLDGDGKEDAALVLAWSGGGSGTFYYAAAAIFRDGAYVGTNGVRLGDRIIPRSLEIRGGVIAVGYLDRRPGQPMAAAPTEARTKRLAVRDGVLREITVP